MKKTLFNALVLILFCVVLLASCGDAPPETEVTQTTDAPETSPTSANCKHAFDVWDVVRAATCKEEGEVLRACKKCGYEERQNLLKLPHTYVDNTCDVCGYISGASSLCRHVFTEWEIIKTPTCFEDGQKMRRCYLCGQTERLTEPRTGIHEYVTLPERAPTCYMEGYTEHIYCAYCELVFKERQYLKRIPHKFKDGECIDCGMLED